MLRFLMCLLSEKSSYHILRTAFQDILRQALVQHETKPCLGVLGAKEASPHFVEQVWAWQGEDAWMKTLSAWRDDGVVCVGLFHMHGSVVPQFLHALMPETYLCLAASLDEKGRLDLLSHHCAKHGHAPSAIALRLIEDGQQAHVA